MRATINHIKESLKDLYPESEIGGIIQILFEYELGYNRTDMILRKEDPLTKEQSDRILNTTKRLKKGEPIQYIVGEVEFYNVVLNVAPGVLIPRPETEELVDKIIKENTNPNARILDIGSGSGCIPLSLKKSIAQALVYSCDVSETALSIARSNAKKNNIDVQFLKHDILSNNDFIVSEPFDIIVSNPPYVLESEMELMRKNVLEYEPHLALFVDDKDPLIFYRAISIFAQNHLKKGGALYFEINEAFGKETKTLMEEYGFSDIQIIDDLFGKPRIAKGIFLK